MTIHSVLEQIRSHLNLSSETERELLEEIQTHLEDAVAEAEAQGGEPGVAMQEVAARFGVDDVGRELQTVHESWESADAILACVIPVALALILRWLIFAPDGSVLGWTEILVRPAFWVVAIVALVVPWFKFNRWPYALAGWVIFWGLTLIFTLFPTFSQW
ncbi:MAG: permease prefix domain 1-containing protein [Chloroflexota bacterium]